MNVQGRWEGKLLDATGVDAQVELLLTSEGEELRGEFRAYFLPVSSDGCAPTASNLAAFGEIAGQSLAAEGKIEINSRIQAGDTTVSVRFQAQSADPDPHAKQALFGVYTVEEGAEALTLQGGTVVLWQYADSEKRKAS